MFLIFDKVLLFSWAILATPKIQKKL